MKTDGLQLTGVTKRYGSVKALDEVDFSVARGEVVALVGDNGAGKSTLVKIMSGAIVADALVAHINGQLVEIDDVNTAQQLGLATVYQDLSLCDNLDVVSNVFLGSELKSFGGVLREEEMEKYTEELLGELSVYLDSLRVPVSMLSGGQRQSVAIARCLLTKPQFVLLDEPTAALGLAQKEEVIQLVRRLRDRGLGVVLISHNLEEVFAVADRVEVLRLGRNAASLPATEEARNEIVSAITGI